MRLTLCVIARDEEENLPRCLASVSEVVDEIVVVDTGSRDRTREVAEAAGARVAFYLWDGSFSAARNLALDLATGDWVLMLDADEELHPGDRDSIRPLLAGEAEGYFFTVLSYLGPRPGADVLRDARLCLFRRRPGYRYERRLHEDIAGSILSARPGAVLAHAAVRVLHYGYLDPSLARRAKAERNRAVLLAALRETPDDPFLLYSLAAEAMGQGEAAMALDLLREAGRRADRGAPWYPDWVKKTAVCLIELGRLDEAREVLNHGVEAFRDFTDLRFLLGVLHVRRGDTGEAEACFEECLRLGEAPVGYASWEGVGTFRAWAALGSLAESRNDYQAAVRCYAAALSQRHDFGPALGRLCRILARVAPRQATAWIARYFDLSHEATAITLARVLEAAGAPGLAGRVLRVALNVTGRAGTPALAAGFAALRRRQAAAWLGGPVPGRPPHTDPPSVPRRASGVP
ncbi:glycosyltransferase [Caldinitratiruptor microaerophilus]|uniref:Glycosyltransferase 2-like domain-containing protein n=1 Tax=Caldinitratiruptor microaerophilus TaxID=671077 RepID=A0AA35CLX0_9FIRM|nr:glycosyltransferase [Caldinitratiruptor microaerophilus]BDG59695.1 hypothetical protein caldi_07850 [Caldinitratiruptor microaerophilus]